MVFISLTHLVRSAGARLRNTAIELPLKGMMKGRYPVTRTQAYLDEGIVLRDCVKIITMHYNSKSDPPHIGMHQLIDQNFSQLQYKNPEVQILRIKNLTPSPFLTFYLENQEKVLVNVEGKSQMEILEHIQLVFGKPSVLVRKTLEANPANFGKGFKRKCICEAEGQLPCMASDEVLPFAKRRYISGKQNWNINPKKYLQGIEEMD